MQHSTSTGTKRFLLDDQLLPSADDVILHVNARDDSRTVTTAPVQPAEPYVAPSPSSAAATARPLAGELVSASDDLAWADSNVDVSDHTLAVPDWATAAGRSDTTAGTSASCPSTSVPSNNAQSARPRIAASRPGDGLSTPPPSRRGPRGPRSQAATARRRQQQSNNIRERFGLEFDSYAHMISSRQSRRNRDQSQDGDRRPDSDAWQVVINRRHSR